MFAMQMHAAARKSMIFGMKKFRIFLSSVQSEFATERHLLAEYICTDALLGRFFDIFLFEEAVARERQRADHAFQ